MSMSTRKRRRDQAFSDEEPEAQLVVEEDANEKQKEKEQEVWDAIREAHYEAIEQLPLTLERQLSLMRKLDEQSRSLTSHLFPTLQRYIRRRQAMSEISENGVETSNEQDSAFVAESVECVLPKTNGHSHTNGGLVAETPFRRLRNGASPRTSTPGSVPPELQKDTETTREILMNIGWISEELLRASQEKVNLAQTNHDSVDRHIRLLDQAIEEEIASLSLGQSRLTTGIAMHLPEVVVPEWRRRKTQIRDTFASDEDLDIANEGQAPVLPEPKKSRTKAAQRNSKKKGKGRNTAGHDDQYKDSIPLTITLPATTQQDDIDIQLNEELYCYCNRESFGEMIACDNDSCEREWFHLGCVGLTEIPEGEWFCEDCRDEDA